MRNKLTSLFTMLALTLTLAAVTAPPAQAQCPMCRMSAESNLNNGGTTGKGLNTGILYMLATPYLIVGTIAFVWWRSRRKEEEGGEGTDEQMNG